MISLKSDWRRLFLSRNPEAGAIHHYFAKRNISLSAPPNRRLNQGANQATNGDGAILNPPKRHRTNTQRKAGEAARRTWTVTVRGTASWMDKRMILEERPPNSIGDRANLRPLLPLPDERLGQTFEKLENSRTISMGMACQRRPYVRTLILFLKICPISGKTPIIAPL
jgi:hypothetical protein